MRKLAFVPLLLVACGDDDPVRHLDGGMIDSPMVMIDAPVMTDPVTLTVTNAGQPVADVKVYFLNPDSSVVSNATTDASGVASAVMPMGGSVTAINAIPAPQGGATYDLTTFNGVKPGDHLKLTASSAGAATQSTLTFPADNTAGVIRYLVNTPCDQETGTPAGTTMFLDSTCGTATDFLVMSFDDAGNIVNYFYVPNEPIATTIDFTNKTWGAPATRDYTFNNTTVFNDSFVSVDDFFSSAKGELANVNLSSTTTTPPPLTYTLAAPAFTNAVEVLDLGAVAGGLAEHHIVHWEPFTTTALTLDVGANALADIISDPTLDTTAHTVAWTEASTGLAADFSFGLVTASRSTPAMLWTWQIVGPHSDTALHFPTLPTDVADFTIGDTDTSSVVVMEQLKVPGGYDGVRANFFDLFFNNTGNGPPAGLFTSATGTLSGEFWQMQQPQRTVKSHPWNVNKLAQLLRANVRSLAPKAPKTSLVGRHK